MGLLQPRIFEGNAETGSQQAETRKNLVGSGIAPNASVPTISAGRVTDHRINLTLYKLEECDR